MIWLIDYNHYSVEMDKELALLRQDYFTIKRFVRARKIGSTAPVMTKTFSNGLLRIATLLSHNDVEVKYLHYYDLERFLNSSNCTNLPEIIAFSAVCPTIPKCARLAEQIKRISPQTQVFVGGAHVNQVPEETLRRYPIFDHLSVGYELQAAETLAGHPLKNFDTFYADYNLLPYPLSDYCINTFTTTGCPFNCDYCADGCMPKISAMLDGQLSLMKNRLPERTLIHFFDSILGYNLNGALNVCDQLCKIDHHFLLSCDMRADVLNPQLINALKKAGFVEIRMGLDTASEELLIKNGRTLMPDKFINQLRMIRDNSNLYISLYSITGLPGTTEKLHQLTLDYISYLHENKLVDEIKNAIYVPYPMKNVDYSKRGVFISDNNWEHYDRASYPVYHLDNMSEKEIWSLFIKTAKWMNTCWLKSCGFDSIIQIPPICDGFHEYYESNYK